MDDIIVEQVCWILSIAIREVLDHFKGAGKDRQGLPY